MRFFLVAALTFSAQIALANARPAPSVEVEINRRLDQRLHVTLQKLIDGQVFQSARSEGGKSHATWLSRR